MANNFEPQLTDILQQAAKKLNLNNYSLNLNLEPTFEHGFASEFYKVSITDNETNNTHHLAVKRALVQPSRRKLSSMEFLYRNEIFFYSEIYPAFNRFEREHQVPAIFNQIPEYITGCDELCKEVVVLRDITKQGFVLKGRAQLLDDEHVRLIFKTYGHFHAISFCLRDEKPEEFDKLTKPLFGFWKNYGKGSGVMNILSRLAEKCYGNLGGAVQEKFQKYKDDVAAMFRESFTYEGQYSAILHGDCWTNNMMFKYQDPETETNLEELKVFDFQLVTSGTPVYDLSYFFYVGGSKELFDRLEEYMDVYYDSFSEAARNLENDPEKLFPRRVLSQEWKKYSKFGMMMAIMLTQVKLASNFNTEEVFKKRTCDIIQHMYEIDAL